MIDAGDDRIALLVQTDADLSGVRAARAGIKDLQKDAQDATTADVARVEKSVLGTRRAGTQLAHLAEIAANGTQSLSLMARSAGHLGEELAHMSGNAAIAASATGIGVLGAAIGVLIGLAIEAKKKLEEIPEGKLGAAAAEHLKNLHDERAVQVELTAIEARRAALQSQMQAYGGAFAGEGGTDRQKAALQAIVDLDAKKEALLHRAEAIEDEERRRRLAGLQVEAAAQTTAAGRYASQLRVIEAERAEAIKTHALSEADANERAATQRRALAKQSEDAVTATAFAAAAARDAIVLNSFAARRAAADRAYEDEKKRLNGLTQSEKDRAANAEYARLQHEGIVAAITREQALANATAKAAVGAGSDNVFTSVNGKLDQIELERQAAIKQGIDEVTATAAAEQKKRALYRETATIAAANGKTIVDALLSSGSKQVQAVGHAADAVRRVLIGAQAAHAAVEAAIEGGKASGSLAAGDFRGAALHGAAALELAKAAALGAQESLGGGGAGAGSGGGGSASNPTTFQPRDASGGGSQVIVLQTVNPFSKEVISEVTYQLGRAGVLKRPIPIAPTIGLQGAA